MYFWEGGCLFDGGGDGEGNWLKIEVMLTLCEDVRQMGLSGKFDARLPRKECSQHHLWRVAELNS